MTPTPMPKINNSFALRTLEFAPLRYVVPRLLIEGCTLLAGRPKLGKSWLALQVAAAVAEGRNALDSTPCEAGDVLYLALEDNERRLQSRLTTLLGGFGREWPKRLQYSTEWPRANDGGVEALRSWITTTPNPRLIIVDVLVAFRAIARSNDRTPPYERDYAAIKALQALASEFHIAILVITHLRKSGAEGDPFEKVTGTLGQSGAADTVLVLDRDTSGFTLYGRGRDVAEMELAVEFSREKCRWSIAGEVSEVRRSDERKEIINVLRGSAEPLSPREVAALVGKSNETVRQTMVRMAVAGDIEKTSRGHYRPPRHNGHAVTETEIPL